MNIVSMAAQYLTPMLVDKIAGALGIQSPMVKMAIGAILPTLMGGFMKTSQSPSGLGKLTDLLGKQDPGLLGNLGNLIGGSGQGAMVNAGTDALGSLLGGSALGSLTGAVSKFAGIGDGPTKSLVGMLAPIALGTLAKEQKAGGLDAAGLAKMLMGQKDNVAAAMPKGFADLLGGSGLLDAVMPAAAPRAAASTTTSASSQAPRSTGTVHDIPRPAPKSNSMVWAAAAAAIALGGWWWFSGVRQPAIPAVPKIVFNNQDVGGQVGSVVEGLRGTLAGIKDEASARTALPRLQETAKQLDTLNEVRGRMPADAKKGLASYVGTLMPIIRPLAEKALATAGVGAIAKPVLDQILGRLDTMAKG